MIIPSASSSGDAMDITAAMPNTAPITMLVRTAVGVVRL